MRSPSRDLAVASSVALALLGCALLVLPYASLGFARYVLPKELCLHLGAAVAGLSFAVAGGRLRLERADLWFIGFAALGVVTAFAATNPWMATRAAALTVSAGVLLVVVRSLEVNLARRLLLAAALTSAVAVALVVIGESQGWFAGLSMRGRAPGGVFGNRNFMAHYLVLALPLAMWAGAGDRRALRVAGAVALVVLVWAVVLSRSRGAWLGGALTLATFAVLTARWPAMRRRLAVLTACIGAGALLALAVPSQLSWSSGYGDTATSMLDYQSGTGRGRVLQYRNTAAMAIDHPLIGVGPGNWSVAYPRYAGADDPSYSPMALTPTNRLPNSDWLGLAAERGLVGLALLLGFAFALGRAAARRALRAPSPAATTILATLAGLALMGSFDAVILQPAPLLLVAVVLAVCRADTPCPAAPLRARYPLVLAAALCLCAAAQAGFAVRGNLAARDARSVDDLARASADRPDSYTYRYRIAARHRARGDCAAAVRSARQALALYPTYPRAIQLIESCR